LGEDLGGEPATGNVQEEVLSAIAALEGREEESEGARQGVLGVHGESIEDNRSGSQCGLNLGKSDNFESKSEGQLLEDTKVVGPMSTSVYRSLMGITTMASPNDDDPLMSHKITFPDGDCEAGSIGVRDGESATSGERILHEKENVGGDALDIGCNLREVTGDQEMGSRSNRIAGSTIWGVGMLGRDEMGRQDTRNHEGDLSEKGQSRSDLDNQRCDSQPSWTRARGSC
jgi:hypothetical protein